MMSSLEEQPPFKEPSSPIGRIQLEAASFITPSPKKYHGDVDQFVDDKLFTWRNPVRVAQHNQD